jgi:hypothetical protein
MSRSAAERERTAGVQVVRLDEPWARRTLMLCHSGQAQEQPGVSALIASLTDASG